MKFSIFNFQFSKKQITIDTIVAPVAIIAFGALLRLLPHPANVAPITAMALFGGVYLNKKYALLVPMLAMIISDVFLGFHNTMVFVYGSFILVGLLGLYLRKHKRIGTVIICSLFSSVLFYVVTNFGAWVMTSMYPKTFTGLMDAYIMGIPFFRNSVIGDLFYVGVFFGGFELVKRLVKQVTISRHLYE